jgi:acetyltransferase-like isoleucine patch superfamily enzyme
MKLGKVLRRFGIPSSVVSLICWFRYRAQVSPGAEVELSANLEMDEGCVIGSFSKVKSADGLLKLGRHVQIGTQCCIASGTGGITIGDDAMISPGVHIMGNNYRYDRLDIPISQQPQISKGIVIGKGVWLGSGVVVVDGAQIGDGVIVTPNSVVSGRVEQNAIVQGNPAKKIFMRR